MIVMEQWYLSYDNGALADPKLHNLRLVGEVTGHPNHEDGKHVITSRIVKIEDNKIVTRTGTRYELGECAEFYAALYPNAKSDLLASYSKEPNGSSTLY